MDSPHRLETRNSTRRDFLVTTAALGAAALGNEPLVALDAPATVSPGLTIEPVVIPDWAKSVTRMSFLAPHDVPAAAGIGVQVVHGNAVWPYYPLRRDGGGLAASDRDTLRKFADDTHRRDMRLVLGLPPFPSVAALKAHPEWRIAPDRSDAQLRVEPDEKNLGTRLACNLGPWGDYLIEICAELMEDFDLDGYSFDGNYHPPICYCSACRAAYRAERRRDLPPKVDLDQVEYREYLVWRGEKLEEHYGRLQQRLKKLRPDAVVMTWTVNAGRYGHFLHSPRAMPSRLNLLIDLPMQEWWLDETNLGASVAPSFGAEYLAAVTGYRKCGCEPYLMSRGNPYSPDSFPAHERMVRSMLVLTHGSTTAHSVGWPHGVAGAAPVFEATKVREPWITHCQPWPWAAMLVSEQTRQFYAYRDIPERFLPHLFGAYRAALEDHLPLSLINDWDVTVERLTRYRVVILPNAAALSDHQLQAIREYVRQGGGLVASTETSLCDELGRPRRDFGLADLLGVSYRGRPQAAVAGQAAIDPNFAIALDDDYWKRRVGSALLTWRQMPWRDDSELKALVPAGSARFKGPQVLVTPPKDSAELWAELRPDGPQGMPGSEAIPGVIGRKFGEGRVVYLPAALDAALWSYAYPYQRVLWCRAVEWAAGQKPDIQVQAPRCVETTYYHRTDAEGRRQLVIHLLNNVNTTAHHGQPASDVPLRDESPPMHGIRVLFAGKVPDRLRSEPGAVPVRLESGNGHAVAHLPPLEIHAMLVGDL